MMPKGFSDIQDKFTVTINVAPGVNYKIAHKVDRRSTPGDTIKAAQAIGVLLLRFFNAPDDPTIRGDLIKARGEESAPRTEVTGLHASSFG